MGTITNDDDFTHGFVNSKTKLWVKGNIDANLSYKVQGDFSSDGGSFVLDDAYGTYKFSDSYSLTFGQFKLPIWRESNVGDQYQLAAQRSIVNSVFDQRRSQGVQAEFGGDSFRAKFAFSDGWRTANTEWDSAAESDWAITGRAEYKWAGDWSRFDDFTSAQGSGNAGMVGAGIHYQGDGSTGDGSDAALNTGTVDFLMYTVDVSVEGDGWNLFGAFIGANTNPDTAGESSTSAYGVLVQAGYMVNANWELFGRWDYLAFDDDVDSVVALVDPNDMHWLSAGVNYYLIPGKHSFKFTLEAIVGLTESYGLRSTNILAADGGSAPDGSGANLPYRAGGILGDLDSGEIGLQAQASILF